jgi:hypothetical protein
MVYFIDYDLELLKSTKVISSLRRIMKNKKVIYAKIEYNNKHKT